MKYPELVRAVESDAPAAYQYARAQLRRISDGAATVRAVAHPLGFVCLPVLRDGETGGCIHVWSPALASVHSTTSDIHCHSWELLSLVLYGSIRHATLSVRDDPDGPDRVFGVGSNGDLDAITATPRAVRVTRLDSWVTGAGHCYRLGAGVFHSSGADRGVEAATLVLSRSRPQDDLTIGPRDTASHTVRRQRWDEAATVRVAQLALARLTIVLPADEPAAGAGDRGRL